MINFDTSIESLTTLVYNIFAIITVVGISVVAYLFHKARKNPNE